MSLVRQIFAPKPFLKIQAELLVMGVVEGAGDVLWIFGEKVAGGPELRSFSAEALKLLPLSQEGLSFLLTFSVAHTHQGEKAQDPTGFPSQIPLM